MAGYLNNPNREINKSGRAICSGKITKIDNFEFEHTLDTRANLFNFYKYNN